ncbi:endonuclease domain-containing protein [Mumia quercus]|uniref:endonuclease domain-containing protein n=1 Tax=Mumia quercus TaxID=2976125 RepID=UPI0021D067DC|nr:endonuclease domain-containing protein [Mumia quercus]
MHRLERIARANGGFVTRSEVLAAGHDDHDVADAALWTSVRRGVYAPKALYDTLDQRARHLLLLRSVLATREDDVVATHDSAVVAHGLGDYGGRGTYGLDLDVAHVARVVGTTSRRTPSVAYHRGPVEPSSIVVVDGIRCVEPVRAVVETMTTVSLDAATVLASSWLAHERWDARRRGMVELFDEESTKAGLRSALHALGRRRGARRAADGIAIADARCGSVAEVRFLVLCWEHDLPRPSTQHEIAFGPDAYAEADFAWPEAGLVVEVDGMLKYADDPDRPGAARTRASAEKRRERALRDVGWSVIRITWADLAPENRARTAAYVRRELDKAARLRARRR